MTITSNILRSRHSICTPSVTVSITYHLTLLMPQRDLQDKIRDIDNNLILAHDNYQGRKWRKILNSSSSPKDVIFFIKKSWITLTRFLIQAFRKRSGDCILIQWKYSINHRDIVRVDSVKKNSVFLLKVTFLTVQFVHLWLYQVASVWDKYWPITQACYYAKTKRFFLTVEAEKNNYGKNSY